MIGANVRSESASRAVHLGGAFTHRRQVHHAFDVEIIAPGVVRQMDGFFYFSPIAILNVITDYRPDIAKEIVDRLLDIAKAAELTR